MDLYHQDPKTVRQMIREGKITSPTTGMCAGYAQGNLVVLPKKYAYDFLLFTQRNPKPCPVLEVSDIGSREFPLTAKGSDIARDIPKYRVYQDGVMQGSIRMFPNSGATIWSASCWGAASALKRP
mgnify:CR=1 FL=1